jgi:hypothetical protein
VSPHFPELHQGVVVSVVAAAVPRVGPVRNRLFWLTAKAEVVGIPQGQSPFPNKWLAPTACCRAAADAGGSAAGGGPALTLAAAKQSAVPV